MVDGLIKVGMGVKKVTPVPFKADGATPAPAPAAAQPASAPAATDDSKPAAPAASNGDSTAANK